MLSSGEAWRIIDERAPRGEWLPLTKLYELVGSCTDFDGADLRALSAKNSSPRWKRTVRNALQRKKVSGAVAWDGQGRYRFG